MSNMFQSYHEVVTVQEMAKMLRVGRNAAYDLVKTKQVPSVRVGNQIRIPKSSVIEFLKNDKNSRGSDAPGFSFFPQQSCHALCNVHVGTIQQVSIYS